MGKTRQEILNACADRMSDVKTFYQAPFINYKGKTSDTKEYFTEVVAEFVCNHINLFQKGILPITRKVSYKTESHIGNVPTSNCEEEIIAIKMFNQSDKEGFIYPHIGEIIDYQTPLKSSNQDKKTGKIDLLSFNDEKMEKQGFCMFVRLGNYLSTQIMEKYRDKDPLIIYSMWSGYLDNSQEMQRSVEGYRLIQLHTSGHADIDTICKMLSTVQPELVIPIHTEAPSNIPYDRYKVVIANDGQEICI